MIDRIQSPNNVNTKFMNFNQFMTIAGDSFRTIIQYPELLRYGSVKQFMCNKKLRERVKYIIDANTKSADEYCQINETLIQKINNLDLQ